MVDSLTGHPAARRLPGFGTVSLGTVDRHPGLLWIAAGGLVLAGLLATFGMPPVSLHAPTHGWGIMGPTCGMTRGVAATVAGDLPRAWAYNPASLLVVGGAVAVIGRSVAGMTTGRWVNLRVAISRGGWLAVVLVLVALTANQQAHADLLLAG